MLNGGSCLLVSNTAEIVSLQLINKDLSQVLSCDLTLSAKTATKETPTHTIVSFAC